MALLICFAVQASSMSNNGISPWIDAPQIGLIMFVSVVSFLYKFKTVRTAFNSDVNALKFQLKNIGTKSLSPAEMEDMEVCSCGLYTGHCMNNNNSF